MLSLLSERNITQKLFALELNMATSTLNGYVKNYRQPDYITLSKIAAYFNVTTDYLLGITNHKNCSEMIQSQLGLSQDEQELIKAYRTMDKKGQAILLDVAKYCLTEESEDC